MFPILTHHGHDRISTTTSMLISQSISRRSPDTASISKSIRGTKLRYLYPLARMNGTKRHINGDARTQPEQFKPTAAFDFRSDTLTSPTKAMLDAIYQTTYRDDGYAEDETTNDLETFIAKLTGKQDALLVMSGVMGNQVAIRTHLTTPPHSVICDSRSHIANHEAGGMSTISGAFPICVSPSNNHHLTLEDVQKHAIISDNVHMCPTRLICLENTCGGMVMPLEEVRRISKWAKENDMRLHMDG